MGNLRYLIIGLLASTIAYAETGADKLEALSASLKNVETIIENVLPLEAQHKGEMSPDAIAISQQFNSDECESNIPDAIDNIDVGEDIDFDIPLFEMMISGPRCPVMIRAGVRTEKVEEVEGTIDAVGQIFIEYLAKDPKLHELGGLMSVNLVGDFRIKASGLDEASKKKVFEVSLDFDAKGKSAKVGVFRQKQKVKINMEFNIPNGFFDVLFNFGLKMNAEEYVLVEFENYKAELVRNTKLESITAPPSVTAFFNGESITTERFDELSKNMTIPGMDTLSGIVDPEPGSTAEMQCLLQVSQPESPFPPFVADNCSADNHFMNINGVNYEAQYVYMEDIMNVHFGSPDSNEPYHSFFLLPDESFQQTVHYEGLNLTLTCQEEVKCAN